MDGSEEVVVARCDCAEDLDFVDAPLDEVALLIEFAIQWVGFHTGWHQTNIGFYARVFEMRVECITFISSVGGQCLTIFNLVQNIPSRAPILLLNSREFEANWEAVFVTQNIDFRSQTAPWGFARSFTKTLHWGLLKRPAFLIHFCCQSQEC